MQKAEITILIVLKANMYSFVQNDSSAYISLSTKFRTNKTKYILLNLISHNFNNITITQGKKITTLFYCWSRKTSIFEIITFSRQFFWKKEYNYT